MGFFEEKDVKKNIYDTYNTKILFIIFIFAVILPLILKILFNLDNFIFIKSNKTLYTFFYGVIIILYYNYKISKYSYILKMYFPEESEYYEEHNLLNSIKTPFGTGAYTKRKNEIYENPNNFDSLLVYYYNQLDVFNMWFYFYFYGGCILLLFIL